MIIKQISVFLENKMGRLSELVNVLAENNIDMQAMSIAEAADFGIVRIVVADPEKAVLILTENGWTVKQNEVLAVSVDDKPGSLNRILTALAGAGMNLAYSYAFFSREAGKATIVIKVNDNEAAEKALEAARII